MIGGGRESVAGLAVAVGMLIWLLLDGVVVGGAWPWALICWFTAAPFLLLLIPEVQAWARARVSATPSLAWVLPLGLAAAGLVVTMAAGPVRWEKVVMWPLCAVAAAAVAVRRRTAPWSPVELLLLALVLGVLAGVYERTVLFIRVPGGTRVGPAFLGALDLALFFCLAVRPLASLDVGFGLGRKDFGTIVLAFAGIMTIGLAIGFAIKFLEWQPRWQGWPYAVARLAGLTLFVGLPEELLFRGFIQEGLARLWNPRAGWLVGSALFGLAHITKGYPPLNWRYAVMATLAGLTYGWVYQRTRKLSAAALTHGGADWLWGTFFHV